MLVVIVGVFISNINNDGCCWINLYICILCYWGMLYCIFVFGSGCFFYIFGSDFCFMVIYCIVGLLIVSYFGYGVCIDLFIDL